MNGKTNNQEVIQKDMFKELFEKQLNNQQSLLDAGNYSRFATNNLLNNGELKLPQDDIGLFSYHIQQLVSEIGELLHSDKRWKSFRNEGSQSFEDKVSEIADIYIVLLNIAIFSGLSAEKLYEGINKKLDEVTVRISGHIESSKPDLNHLKAEGKD